jgi:SAM-dependent methyltransferase
LAERIMTTTESLALVIILIGIVGILVVLLLLPILYGLPWVPTRRSRIRSALDLARVSPGEVVYDLGAGDGRVLITAARDYGARAVGIEISPLLCLIARLAAMVNGVSDRVRIRLGNLHRVELEDADVVFAYLTAGQAERLRLRLESQLRAGARVVTVASDFRGWEPAAIDRQDLIFLYEMPPRPGDVGSYLAKENSLGQGTQEPRSGIGTSHGD